MSGPVMFHCRVVPRPCCLPAIVLAIHLLAQTVFAAGSVPARELSGSAMGTSWQVKFGPPVAVPPATVNPEVDLDTAIPAAIERVEQQMSTWRPDSEVSLFNKSRSVDWFPVSADTARVVAAAQDISQASDGAFDITVAPLIRLWNFDAEPHEFVVPSDEDIAAARSVTGWQKLHVQLEPPALRKEEPALEINLSAIAKGYAVDMAAEVLEAAGIENYLVEIGGEIRGRGRNASGEFWRIGIEQPTAAVRQIHRTFPLADRSLATSGDYRNFYEIDGQIYSHTIDPSTGRPIRHGLASVSIFAATCMQADALATAVNVLGPERGMRLAEAQGVAALLLVRDGDTMRSVSNAALDALAAADITDREAGNPFLRTFLAALGLFALAVCGMAVGVIFSNRRLQGSCGGLASMQGVDGQSMCEICTTPPEECRTLIEAARQAQAQGRSFGTGASPCGDGGSKAGGCPDPACTESSPSGNQ